jgi:hypothetical protein
MLNDAWKDVVSVPGDDYILLIQIMKQGSEDDLRFAKMFIRLFMQNAGWGRGMAADHDQGSCLTYSNCMFSISIILLENIWWYLPRSFVAKESCRFNYSVQY